MTATARRLMDSDTAEILGYATVEQVEASDASGIEGHIMIDIADGTVVPPCEREQYVRHLSPGAELRRVYVEAE